VKATDILMQEHRLIERVLNALQAAANHLSRGDAVRPGFFLDAADFIAGYADGCHHHKEEDVLFGTLGGPETVGVVDMMLDEHQAARTLTRGMRDAARRLESGDESARIPLMSNARQYVALLRDHIEKEDEMLFPMADELLSAEQQGDVSRGIERIEREEAAAGMPEKFRQLAENLEAEAKMLRASG
jgi:hemerythrin-like domain-containing protein